MSNNYQKIHPRSTESTTKILWWALGFSFFVHLISLPLTLQQSLRDEFVQNQTEDSIRIKIKSEKQKQIVNNTNTGLEAKPDEAKFLSEKNQIFKEQKVAKTIGSFQEAGKGVLDGKELEKAQAKTTQAQTKQSEMIEREKKRLEKKAVSLSDLAVEAKELVTMEEQFASPFQALGAEDATSDSSGLAKNNDFIEDLPLGDVTQLNTQEYMYFGFYHRIRQKLEQHWGNTLQEKADYLFRRGGRMPANENMITALVVTMDHAGQIIDVKVKSTSGINELDSAAIESFNRAGPFPNPPEGMVKNGKVQIEWGFVVKS